MPLRCRYAFAKAHKILLIDEFDLIEKDLLMYRAFPPRVFRKRVANIPETMDTTWTIRVQRGRILREGPLADHDRAKGVESLMSRFAALLPDMTIVYNGHDNARIAVAAEERIRLEGLAKRGECAYPTMFLSSAQEPALTRRDPRAVDDDEDPPFDPKERGPFPNWGYPIFCPPDSPARELGFEHYGYHAELDATGFEMPPHPEGSIGSLVGDFKGYMDVCYAPHYRHAHCTTSWVFSHHPTPVMPMFTPGVQTTFGDVHALIVEQLELEAKHDPTWEERPFTSLQWRGQTSGPLWESITPWRTSQRARLHLLSHQEDGTRNITVTDENDVMHSVEVPNYRVNPLFLDAGMVGPAVQCVEEDGTCAKMFEVFQGYDKRISFDRASLYKYVLGPSSSFSPLPFLCSLSLHPPPPLTLPLVHVRRRRRQQLVWPLPPSHDVRPSALGACVLAHAFASVPQVERGCRQGDHLPRVLDRASPSSYSCFL